jgi:DNA-binding SARP family transcriptional activator/tetratricopeptide (TPR) repeat protein
MIKLVTLGGVAISRDGVQLGELTALRQKVALLAYVSLEGPIARDRLLPLFWPDRAEERARHALSQALYVLRQELGEQCVRVVGDQVEVVASALDVDAQRLQRSAARERWEDAIAVYHGPFLEEFHLPGTPQFEHWQTRTRARLARLARQAFAQVVNDRVAAGDLEGALKVASRRAALEPLEDEAQHTLIALLALAGHRAAALEHFDSYRRQLARELEVEPLEETEQLVEQIRAGDVPEFHGLASAPPTDVDEIEEATEVAEPPSVATEAGVEGAAPWAAVEDDAEPTDPRRVSRLLRAAPVYLVGAAYVGVVWLTARLTGALNESGLLPSWALPVPFLVLGAGLPLALLLSSHRWRERALRSGQPRAGWLRGVTKLGPGPVLAVLAFLSLGLLEAQHLLERSSFSTSAPDPDRIVVFPLVVSNEDHEIRLLGEDVATWIGYALEGTEPLKWLDGWQWLDEAQRNDPRLLTADVAGAITRARGAGRYLDGRVVWRGDSAAVLLRMHDVAGDADALQAGASGGADDIIRLGLRATARLLQNLIAPDGHVVLSGLSGQQPAAIANFLQGERAYRRARFQQALDHYRNAVAADSSFWLAALKGAQAASWNHRYDEAEMLVETALAGGAASVPCQAHLARGLADYFAGRADSAVSNIRRALAVDPECRDAWTWLGEVYTHLLPNDSPLDSLAEAAFTEALRLDPGFTPALYHLIEFSVRKGDVGRAQVLLEQLREAGPDMPGLVETGGLMLACVEGSPDAIDWPEVVQREPDVVYQASNSLSVGAFQAECARAGWRALLDYDTAADAYASNRRFNAALGLQSLLVAEMRYEELREVLENDIPYADLLRSLYILDAVAGPGLEVRAEEAAERFREYYRSEYVSGASLALFLWFLGVWEAHRDEAAAARAIADSVAALAQKSGTRVDELLARSLEARAALASGDSTRAIEILSGLVPTKRRGDPWYPYESLGGERLALAELLYARSEHAEVLMVASSLDAPARPPVDLIYLPTSLQIRLKAAEAVHNRTLAKTYRTRLAALGRDDLAAEAR